MQDPRKETLPQRDLFPTRVCLRVTDHRVVDLVLTDGAHERGAVAEQIPDERHGGAGIGYVLLDGQREPTRVRAAWVSDDDIAATITHYTPPPGQVIDITGRDDTDEGAAA